MSTPVKLEEVVERLEYIASSPPEPRGGFHPNAVAAARGGLAIARALRVAVAALERIPESSSMTHHNDCDCCIHHRALREIAALVEVEPEVKR